MSAARLAGWTAACVALLTGLTMLAYQPPAARGLDADVLEFSAARALQMLHAVLDSTPHPIGSAGNAQVRAAIVARLQALGYRTELQSGLACSDGTCAYPVNIIAREPRAAAQSSGLILLAAHYDSVPAGVGAADDGSGVAALLEIARILRAREPSRHDIVLLFTDGEEAGLLGARLFMTHPLAGRCSAAVNVDSRGTSGLSLMFETGSANAALMALYARSVSRPIASSLFYDVYRTLPHDTDFSLFKKSMQGFNFAFIGDVGRYHTALDLPSNLSTRTLQQQGENALSTVLALAASDASSTARAAVYFDVFGRWLIRWPAAACLPAAVALLLALLLQSYFVVRAEGVARREILYGGAAALASLVLSPGLCLATWWILSAYTLPSLARGGWIAHPFAMQVCALAIGVTTSLGCATALAGRARAEGLWLGAGLVSALLAVLIAPSLPGASYLLIVPTATMVLANALLRWRARPAVALAATLPGWLVLIPVLLLLYAGLGATAWPLLSFIVSFALLPGLSALAALDRTSRNRALFCGVALALAGALVSLVVPVYSNRWPARVNIVYRLDADTRIAQWQLRSGTRLPAGLRLLLQKEGAVPSGAGEYVFNAAPLALPAPQLQVLASWAQEHRYHLKVRSQRAAQQITIYFPAESRVRQIATLGAPLLNVPLDLLPDGRSALRLLGLGEEGFEFIATADGTLEAAEIIDESGGVLGADALQRERNVSGSSTQDGDVTQVRTRILLSAAGP